MTNVHKVNRIASYFLGFMATFLAVVFWFLFVPVKVIEVTQPYKVLTPEVKVGENLVYEVEYKKYKNTPATIYRSIVCNNGHLFTLTPKLSNVPSGEHKVERGDVVIPEKISPGSCYLDVVLVYKVNMFRHEYLNFVSESFQVL